MTSRQRGFETLLRIQIFGVVNHGEKGRDPALSLFHESRSKELP